MCVKGDIWGVVALLIGLGLIVLLDLFIWSVKAARYRVWLYVLLDGVLLLLALNFFVFFRATLC
jgi:hypothetical protein